MYIYKVSEPNLCGENKFVQSTGEIATRFLQNSNGLLRAIVAIDAYKRDTSGELTQELQCGSNKRNASNQRVEFEMWTEECERIRQQQ